MDIRATDSTAFALDIDVVVLKDLGSELRDYQIPAFNTPVFSNLVRDNENECRFFCLQRAWAKRGQEAYLLLGEVAPFDGRVDHESLKLF